MSRKTNRQTDKTRQDKTREEKRREAGTKHEQQYIRKCQFLHASERDEGMHF